MLLRGRWGNFMGVGLEIEYCHSVLILEKGGLVLQGGVV